MTIRAFTFPGQGSQFIGMGKELSETFPAARSVFEEVDEALGDDLSRLMFEGDESELRLTRNAQPALMAVSMAVVKVLEEKGVTVGETASFVAGHSLGEYSALCAAGTFSIADTARLLRTRGDAMQQAAPVGSGAMAAILGLDLAAVEQVVEDAAHGEICQVANDNAPGQVVVSGAASAVERAIELAKAAGARRALLLPVSAPFHCALMAPAAETMENALAHVTMAPLAVPLVANVLAAPESEVADIRKNLVAQVTGRVRWRESVDWMASEGQVSELVELGAGKVLTGLARRINRDLDAVSVSSPADIDEFVQKVKD